MPALMRAGIFVQGAGGGNYANIQRLRRGYCNAYERKS